LRNGTLGAALDQVAVYILLTQDLVDHAGGNPDDAVSMTAMLIAPKNVGLAPTLETQDVTNRVKRVRGLLRQTVPLLAIAAGLPTGIFGQIADTNADAGARLDLLDALAEKVGTRPKSGCLSTCGAARYCRARSVAAGSPVIGGDQIVRLLPSVSSLPRAAELARGAPPTAIEVPVAGQLLRASRLYAAKAGQGR